MGLLMGDWSFLFFAFLILCGLSAGIIDIIAIVFILYFTDRIKKYINKKYFFIFACYSFLGILMGSLIGGIFGSFLFGMKTEVAYVLLKEKAMFIFFELIGIISISPVFIILCLVIYFKNSSIAMTSTKQRTAKVGFLSFSILSCLNVFTPFAIINIRQQILG